MAQPPRDPLQALVNAITGQLRDPEERVFTVDPVKESGGYYRQYQNKIYGISLSLPSYYQQMRANLEQELLFDLQRLLYKTVYYALKEGTNVRGRRLLDLGDAVFQRFRQAPNQPYLVPGLPEHLIQKAAYDASLAMEGIITKEIVERLLPADLSKVANTTIQKRTSLKMANGDNDI